MNNTLLYILQVTFVFSILYILYTLVLSNLTFHKINRIVLLLLLPISVIVPFSNTIFPSLSIEIKEIPLLESVHFDTVIFESVNSDTVSNQSLEVLETPTVVNSFNYTIVLITVYFLMLSIYLTRILITTRKLFLLKNNAIVEQKKGYQFVKVDVPEIFSYFNCIFIPKHQIKEYDEQIIEHEKIHIQLKHSWDVLFTEIYICFFWFNPLVYFYRKSLKSIHEFQADEGALQKGIKTSEYIGLLLKSLELEKPNNLYNYFNQPILKKRVIMMTKPTSNGIAKLKYILLLPVCAFLISAFTSPIIENNEYLDILGISNFISTPPSLFPVKNATKNDISSYFGEKARRPKTKRDVAHRGIDIKAKIGTPIFATADGIIKEASMKGKWGNLIIITHADGYETWYAHLNAFNINVKEEVKKGAIIGYVGNTGFSTGPHLHYEVKQHGKHLNPIAFLGNNTKKVVIDVSHGGKDGGVSLGGLNEKKIALNIAKKIKALNKNENIEIILTRDSDQFISLNKRAKKINKLKPDFVISLHLNSDKDKNKNGMEIFVSDKNKQKEKSEKLAANLFNSFKDRTVKIKKADLYLLKNIEYPITLIEMGYLSNKKDREFLTSENGQLELASLVLKAIK